MEMPSTVDCSAIDSNDSEQCQEECVQRPKSQAQVNERIKRLRNKFRFTHKENGKSLCVLTVWSAVVTV